MGRSPNRGSDEEGDTWSTSEEGEDSKPTKTADTEEISQTSRADGARRRRGN
jgi:hypothetical protein